MIDQSPGRNIGLCLAESLFLGIWIINVEKGGWNSHARKVRSSSFQFKPVYTVNPIRMEAVHQFHFPEFTPILSASSSP
jgi:hypothetical protein